MPSCTAPSVLHPPHSLPPPPGTQAGDLGFSSSGSPGSGGRSDDTGTIEVSAYTHHGFHVSREFQMNALTSMKYFLHKGVTFGCFLTGPQRVDTFHRGLTF